MSAPRADDIAERAEDALASMSAPPSTPRLRCAGYVAIHRPNPNPLFGRVDRLRLPADSVEEAIADVRNWFADLERKQFSWCVGRHARPADLAERLAAAGAVPDQDPEVVVMVLEDDPPEVSGVEVRPVVSLADFEAERDIRLEAFEFTEEQRQASIARTETTYAEYLEGGEVTIYLAMLDGVPVASAGLAFTTDRLALLLGSGTLEQARGQGAYRALVRARWEEAQRRGAAGVVVHAGRMSRPILQQLGFRTVSSMNVLVDESRRAVE